jgi:hypothetical protein
MKALSLLIFSIVILAAAPAWSESLVDIKVDELSRPVKPKWGRDPFVRFEDRGRSANETLGPTDLRIEGIISDENRALVIINGGFYRKGDMIDGFVIDQILSDKVMLLKGSMSYVLRMKGFTAEGPGKEVGQ